MTLRFDKKNSAEEIIESTNFLIERYTFATMKDTDEIYHYDSDRGIYVKGGEVFIKKKIGCYACIYSFSSSHRNN